MKRSNQFTPLIVAAGLSLLAVPAFAQNSGSSAGSNAGSGSDSSRNSTSSSTTPSSTDTLSPGNSGAHSNSSTNSSASGALDSTTNSTNSSIPSATEQSPVSSGINSANQVGVTNSGFDRIDTDQDGKLSLTEYTSTSVVTPGKGMDQRSSSSVSTDGSSSSSVTSGGSQNSAETFRALDTNHDGYLTRDEINASKVKSGGLTQP